MNSQLSQFESYALNNQQKSTVIGGRYGSYYRAYYQTESGTFLDGYLAKDEEAQEWVFLYWKGDEMKSICIAAIDNGI